MGVELEQLERRNKITEGKLVDTYRSYRKAFGVHVKSSHEDVLAFTFTNIARDAPNREYMVEVEVLDNNYKGTYPHISLDAHSDMYILYCIGVAKRCAPMIADFDKLATRLELGDLDSLAHFLRDVRKGFVQLSQ